MTEKALAESEEVLETSESLVARATLE